MNKRYWWLNEESRSMLERGYLVEGQTVEDKIDLICKHAAKIHGDLTKADKFKEVFEKGWASLSSPIWANFGQDRALPISCFSSYVSDSLSGIFNTLSEVAMMTKMGGGTAGYFDLRPLGASIRGGSTSSGALSFIKLFEDTIEVVKQNDVRRGAFSPYMDIEHPEIQDFLCIKDKGHEIQTLNTGVCVSDDWMKSMIEGDKDKRDIWARVLRSRREKGVPYLFFTDTANNNKPQVYKDKDLHIRQSNLCNEIFLPTSIDESLVCCLLSMNLYTYDEWKDSDAVELMIEFLDAVMEDFISKLENYRDSDLKEDQEVFRHMKRAYTFALKHRALGLGVLGWHSYLQYKMIPFESFEAQLLNTKIFKSIKEKALKSSHNLAVLKGEPELLKGYGMRNTTLLALAPTTSSSSILGQVSPSIEPFKANYYRFGGAKGSFTRKNKHLQEILVREGKDTDEVWEDIRNNKGSVQHLDFLTDLEKDVFKTFEEISPISVIQQASARQRYICQGQSLNLVIPNEMPIKDINKIHIEAWKLGLKGLYYQRGSSVAKESILKKLSQCGNCEA